MYRGIIIKESLQDERVLDSVNILSKKVVDEGTAEEWHMLKVEVSDDKIHVFVDKLSNSLKGHETWYTHFYHEDPLKNNLIVVFYKKIFRRGKSDTSLKDAVSYGLKEGIPIKQLDFMPRDVSQETW